MLLEHKTQAPTQTNLDRSPKLRLAAAILVGDPGKADLNAPRLMNSRAKSLDDLIDNAAKNQSEHLNLANMGLTHIPEQVWHLKHLKSLNLERNQLEIVDIQDSSRCFMPNLTKLNIRHNQIRTIQLATHCFPSLSLIAASDNRIDHLSKSDLPWSTLKFAKLDQNKIKRFVADLTLSPLKYLNLSNNPLDSIPDGLNAEHNIEQLFLRNCGLTEFPERLINQKRLRYLSLCNNDLSDIQQLNLLGFEVGVLELSMCGLDRFPTQLLNVVHKRLDVSFNNIGEVRLLPNGTLEELNLEGNSLTQFPSDLQQLPNLRHLDLGRNNIEQLPSTLSGLMALEFLSIKSNKIAELPSWLEKLSNLEYLDISANRLLDSIALRQKLTGLKCLWSN